MQQHTVAASRSSHQTYFAECTDCGLFCSRFCGKPWNSTQTWFHCGRGTAPLDTDAKCMHWTSRPFAERLTIFANHLQPRKKPWLQPFAIIDISVSVPMQNADPFDCDGFATKYEEQGMYTSSISTDADVKIDKENVGTIHILRVPPDTEEPALRKHWHPPCGEIAPLRSSGFLKESHPIEA